MKRRIHNSIIDLKALNLFLESKRYSGDHEELLRKLEELVDQSLVEEINKSKKRDRITQNDDRKEQQPAKGVLSAKEIQDLPKWVREQIDTATLLGKSRDVIQVADGRKYHRRNRLNELAGSEWTYFLNSVVSTRYPTTGPESYAHHIRKIHPSPKPPQLMRSIIEFFTKTEDLVMDFFMGVGGTLIGASLCGRNAIGIDINADYIEGYEAASRELGLTRQTALVADSREVLRDRKRMRSLVGEDLLSLVLIDPPYGDMMSRKKTGEAAKAGRDTSPTPYSHSLNDLGNMTKAEFLANLSDMVDQSMSYLKTRGHVVVFMKDLQPTKLDTNLLHAEVINTLAEIAGLDYLGTKIWADQSVNLYPYGYPFAFVSNQIHQYIIVFRKE